MCAGPGAARSYRGVESRVGCKEPASFSPLPAGYSCLNWERGKLGLRVL